MERIKRTLNNEAVMMQPTLSAPSNITQSGFEARDDNACQLRLVIARLIQSRRVSLGLPALPPPTEGKEAESKLFILVESWLPVIRASGISPKVLSDVFYFALGLPLKPGEPFGPEHVVRAYPRWLEFDSNRRLAEADAMNARRLLSESRPDAIVFYEGLSLCRAALVKSNKERN